MLIGGVVIVGAVALIGTTLVSSLREKRSAERAAVARYNVMLITLDTTRADHLGCYGYPKHTSPNLDALAADGVRFELAISTSALTPISHASILTGLNPDQHGLRVIYGPTGHFLQQEHPTLATILKSYGWDTGAFISAYTATERFGLHWGFNTFETGVADWVMTLDPAKRPPRDAHWQRKQATPAQRRADATTDQALAWLERARRPFFIWAHYFDPHDVWLIPPEEVTDRFDVHPGEREAPRAAYDAEIFFMDQQIGRLVDWLRETGEYENTVIVVLADHGQGLGDHGWFRHRLLYQEQIRVPLIMRAPRGERGLVLSQPVRNIDVMPTVLEILGFELPQTVQGSSLFGLMRGRPDQPRVAYAEALNTMDAHAPPMLPSHQQDLLFAVTDGIWKLIYHKNSPENSELYNLRSDPKELDNVARLFPLQRDRLVKALEQSGAMTVEIIEPSSPLSDDDLEKLRALGYVAD